MTITHTTTRTGLAAATNRGCEAAARRLRWEYTVTYRRHQRLYGTHNNNLEADQTACEHLRNLAPIVLARHLPGIQLTHWDDPHPAVIDSTWRHGEIVIDVFWDYHTGWTIGDPTAITVHIHEGHR